MKNNQFSTKPTCFARRHMTRQEYCVYDLSMGFANIKEEKKLPQYKGRKIVFFNAHRMAKEFGDGDRSSVYKAAASLVKNGWFKVVKDTQYARGRKTSRHYEVRTHDEWLLAKDPETGIRYSETCACSKTRGAIYEGSNPEDSEDDKLLENEGVNEEAKSLIETELSPIETELSPIETSSSLLETKVSPIETKVYPQTAIACNKHVESMCNKHVESMSGAGGASRVSPSSLPMSNPEEPKTDSETSYTQAKSPIETSVYKSKQSPTNNELPLLKEYCAGLTSKGFSLEDYEFAKTLIRNNPQMTLTELRGRFELVIS